MAGRRGRQLSCTKLEYENIRNLLAAETWFDADQAIENGFADELMEDDESIEVAAYLEMKMKGQERHQSKIEVAVQTARALKSPYGLDW